MSDTPHTPVNSLISHYLQMGTVLQQNTQGNERKTGHGCAEHLCSVADRNILFLANYMAMFDTWIAGFGARFNSLVQQVRVEGLASMARRQNREGAAGDDGRKGR